MKVNKVVKHVFWWSMVAVGPCSCKEAKRPNIVFIMSDDHAYQAISAYNHPISKIAPTPNIDRIAQAGILFRRAFVENSISAPSRATLLTGMYSHHHGQRTLQYGIMDTTITHFTERLQQAGYHTALFGKWHLSIEPKGFDYYDILYDQGEYYNPRMRTPQTKGEYVTQEGYATEVITDHALEWLSRQMEQPQGEPFCLMIHHKAPHRNWMPAPQDLSLYEDLEFEEPSSLFDDYSNRTQQMQQQQLTLKDYMGYAFDFKVEELKDEPTLPYIRQSWDIAMESLNTQQRAHWDSTYRRMNHSFLENPPQGDDLLRWKYQRYVHDYCRTIHSLDTQIGRVLDYLEEHNLMENTLIVYTSDQGFFLGEHGLYDKRFMYEEALRTPLIISWKGHIRSSIESFALTQNIDLAPTLLDVANVQIPEECDGVSLRPLFGNGKARKWRKSVYYQYYDFPAVGNVRKHYGIRTDRYKLIHWQDTAAGGLPPIDEWELFDLQDDPNEMHNVYGLAKYKKVKEQLHRQLDNKRKKIFP